MRPRLLCCLVLALAVLAPGCGPTRLRPRGRLTRNDTPFVPDAKETVHITFFPAKDQPAGGGEGEGCVALFNREDSTFQAVGRDGKGLPPGKYRITVQVMKNKKDEYQGYFGPAGNPFVRDVAPGGEEIVLDLKAAANAPARSRALGPANRRERR
ncbi:MAG TPA: hypothetical protein VFE78_18485 [Gemmataceae bacterium]|nr:hypothetical protein [Gemmataceae bacterium]